MKKIYIISILLLAINLTTGQHLVPLIKHSNKVPDFHEKKISTLVLDLVAEMYSLKLNSSNIKSTGYLKTHNNFLFQIDELARIQITISFNENLLDIKDFLIEYDCEITAVNADFSLITAWIPFQNILQIAKHKNIINIQETEKGHVRTGSVTSEGDTIHNADIVRSVLGANGTGITVGVISDGCDNIVSAQATNDLPLSINVIDNSEGGDEGTAMLEIVHDLAPGANLAFSEGIQNSVEFINSINDLVTAGCDVVVDDIGYFGEPYFEEGPIAMAARNAIENNGIVYASSAGNSQDEHYEGDYLSAGTHLSIPDVHDFGGGDWTQQFSLYANQTFYIFMQWNDEFGSSINDYRIHIANDPATFDYGITNQIPNSNNPYVYVAASGGPGTFNIIIEKVAGSSDRRIELVYYFTNSASVNEYNDLPGSINGQPAVSEVIAAGAVRYSSPDIIEYFSSIGPSRIYSYPSYSYEDRNKPDIVAVDGNIITGAGGFGQGTPPRFYGTSAAAPHAAACAALVWSAFPNYTNTEVKQRILNSAVDFGTTGFDYTYGYGRIDVQQASDSPQFTVSGINGGNNSLINSSVSPGDNLAELTGYVLSADQSPYLVYLNSMTFTIAGSATSADINNFFLYEDVNDDQIIIPGTDNLLSTKSYSTTVTFDSLNILFTNSGINLILTADINSLANPNHSLEINLQNSSNVEAYFNVNPASINFPFNSNDISLPVELVSFNAIPRQNSIELIWETKSETENMGFIIQRSNNKDKNFMELDSYLSNISLIGNGNSAIGKKYSLLDKTAIIGIQYWYKLIDISFNGIYTEHPVTSAKLISGNNELIQIGAADYPTKFALFNNYPNPFNPVTKIPFNIPENLSSATQVKISVFNILGSRIKNLFFGKLNSGKYEIIWDGTDVRDIDVPSGIYIYTIETEKYTNANKMLLVR